MNYNLSGITFNANEAECGAFHVFNPDRPEATDRLPDGMVEEMKAFIRITEPMRCLLDVGALFGIFSIVFTRNKDAVAYAVEPSEWAYPFLLEHISLNPTHRIVPIHKFIGDTEGKSVACSRDWKHVVANLPAEGRESSTLHETRIDDLGITDRIDCMKIDVEGYECAVLRGAKATIAKHRPVIFLECHLLTLANNKESEESLMADIVGLGYAVRNYSGDVIESFSGDFCRVVCYPK